jgi:hypothetical protein
VYGEQEQQGYYDELSYNSFKIKTEYDVESDSPIASTMLFDGDVIINGNKLPNFLYGTEMPDDGVGEVGDIYIRTLNQL